MQLGARPRCRHTQSSAQLYTGSCCNAGPKVGGRGQPRGSPCGDKLLCTSVCRQQGGGDEDPVPRFEASWKNGRLPPGSWGLAGGNCRRGQNAGLPSARITGAHLSSGQGLLQPSAPQTDSTSRNKRLAPAWQRRCFWQPPPEQAQNVSDRSRVSSGPRRGREEGVGRTHISSAAPVVPLPWVQPGRERVGEGDGAEHHHQCC